MFIHILYNKVTPPDWNNGVMRFVGKKPNGWNYGEEMNLAEIQEPYDAVYKKVVKTIAGKGEPWMALQIWAFLEGADAVSLEVEAVHDETGAIRTFRPADDEAYLITDKEVVGFFKHFTE